MWRKTRVILLAVVCAAEVQAQYITEVLEYKPAPGQFINSPPWGIPHSVNSLIGNNTGSLSLGAFGGYVVFRFAGPVENDPDNPFGVDFTIFGNPSHDMSEPGIVSVMNDENRNGLPDDVWYELAGSEYFFSSTTKDYEVTYYNPAMSSAADVPWSDNQGNSGFIPANVYHPQPYYPITDSFPCIPPDEYTLKGTVIAGEIDRSNPSLMRIKRKAFGYADNQFRGIPPYTLPDNPYTPEKENSGGDGFDISWAVDENGEYVDLEEVHFIKVYTAILADAGWLGEVSTEITGAVDVAPGNTVTGNTELIVLKDLPGTITGNNYQIEAIAFDNGRWNNSATINWSVNLPGATINEENQLSFTTSGKVIITASLAGNPSITASDSSILVYQEHPSSADQNSLSLVRIYPNPAPEYLIIEGVSYALLDIYDLTGHKVLSRERIMEGEPVSVAQFEKGIYLVHIILGSERKTMRLVKV